MLDSRNVSAILSGETLRASAVRGCLQGGVLSPLLWSLVVDDLWELISKGYDTTGHADDIANLINRKFPHIVSGSLTNSPVHSPKVVRKDKPVYQSKQDGNYAVY
jgi:hypothetical protein